MSSPFILAEDPQRLVEHWCYTLPPGGGLIDRLTTLFRGLMRSPHLQLHQDRIELFVDCPALAIPRRMLSPQSQEMLNDLEHREALVRQGDPGEARSSFHGYRSLPDGDFCLFEFEGDERLADVFDSSILIEALARALYNGGGDIKYEVSEICRSALMNTLLLEPVPVRPPDVIAIERKYTATVETELEREEPTPLRSPPPPPDHRQVAPRFLKPFPKQRASSSSSQATWNRFDRSDALELELETARKAEKAYLRACDLRTFVRLLIDRIAQWS